MAADWNPDEGFQTEVAEPAAAPATPAWSPDEGFGTTPTPDTPSTPVLPKASASAGYGAISTPVEPAPPMDQPDETQVWSPNDGFDTAAPVFEPPVVSQQGADDGGDEETPVMQVNEQPDMGIMGWLGDRARDIGNWAQDIGDGFNVAGQGIERIQQGDIGGGLAQVGGGLAEGLGTAIKPANDLIMAPFIAAGRTLPQAYNTAKDLGDDNVDPNSFQGQMLQGARKAGPLAATAADAAAAGISVGQTFATQGPEAAWQRVQQAFQNAEGKGWGDYADLEDRAVSIPRDVPVIGGYETTLPAKSLANLAGEIAPYFAPVFGQVGAAGKGLSALGGAGKVVGAPLQAYGRVGQAALEAPNKLVTAVAGGNKVGAALTAGAFTSYLGATALPKIEKVDENGERETIWDPARIMGSDPSGIVLPLAAALGMAALWRGGGGATIAFDKALGAATGNALRGRVLTQITSNEKPVYVRDNGPAIDMGQGAPVPVPLEVVGVNRAKLPQGVRIAEPGEVVAKYSNIAQDRPIAAATRSVQGVEQVLADLARVADNDPQTAGPILRDFLTNPDSTVLGGLDSADVKAAKAVLNRTIDRYVDIERNTVLGQQDARADVINRLLLQNDGDGAQFGANLMQKATDQVVRELGIKNADWQTSNIRRFTALTDQLFEDRTLAVRLGEELKRQGGNAAVLVKDSPEYRRLLGDFVDPNKAGANRGLTERRVGEVLTRVEKAWQDVQRSGREQGTVYRTPDALNPRLRGFGQNEFVDAMAMSKAIMSPYLLSGAPRYFINNLIGDSINLALSTHGRAFGTPTEAAMRQRLGNWGLGGLLDGQWASGGSIKNAMGQDSAPYRLPNQTGRVRAIDQFAKDRAPGVMGAIDTVTLNRPLRAFGERVQDMAVLGEAYRRRMALTAEVLPVVERNFGLLVEQRARANGATPEQARQLARDVVQAVSTDGLGALKQQRFRLPGLDLDGIPREYQADIRRAWRESRGDPARFQQRVNTLLDDTLATIKSTIETSPSTQARNLFGVIVDGQPYQPPVGTGRGVNRVPGDGARQITPEGTARNVRGVVDPTAGQSRLSDILATRNEPLIGSGQRRPGAVDIDNAPRPAGEAQIPVNGVSNRLTGLIPDDVIQVARASHGNVLPFGPKAKADIAALLQEVRSLEGVARGEYRSHSANVKLAAGEKLSKLERDILEGRVFDDGVDLEPRQVYRNVVAILQAESGLTKTGSTRTFYDLGKLDAVIRSATPKRLAETERFLRAYQSFLQNYDVLRMPKGKAKTTPVVTVPKGSVPTPADATGLQAYLDAANQAAAQRRAGLAAATDNVAQGRPTDIIAARNWENPQAYQGPAATGPMATPRYADDGVPPAVPEPTPIRRTDRQPGQPFTRTDTGDLIPTEPVTPSRYTPWERQPEAVVPAAQDSPTPIAENLTLRDYRNNPALAPEYVPPSTIRGSQVIDRLPDSRPGFGPRLLHEFSAEELAATNKDLYIVEKSIASPYGYRPREGDGRIWMVVKAETLPPSPRVTNPVTREWIEQRGGSVMSEPTTAFFAVSDDGVSKTFYEIDFNWDTKLLGVPKRSGAASGVTAPPTPIRPDTSPVPQGRGSSLGGQLEPWQMTRAEFHAGRNLHGSPQPELSGDFYSPRGQDQRGFFTTTDEAYARHFAENSPLRPLRPGDEPTIFVADPPQRPMDLRNNPVHRQAVLDAFESDIQRLNNLDFTDAKKQRTLDNLNGAWKWTRDEVTGDKQLNSLLYVEQLRGELLYGNTFASHLMSDVARVGGFDAIQTIEGASPTTIYLETPKAVSHRQVVAQALHEGKPVPEAVRAEYPDLAARYPAQPPNPDFQRPGVFRGTQPTPAEIRAGDTQPKTGAEALALANQGLPEIVTRPGSKAVVLPGDVSPAQPTTAAPPPGRTRAAADFRAENGIPPVAPSFDTAPVRQNFTRGQENISVQFTDRTQRDLYNLEARFRQRMTGKNPKAFPRDLIDSLKSRLGLDDNALGARAKQVYDEVRAQVQATPRGTPELILRPAGQPAPQAAPATPPAAAPQPAPQAPPSRFTQGAAPDANASQTSGKTVQPRDPRGALDDVMARTMSDHLTMAKAFDDLTRRVMAVPDDVRLAPDFPDRVREAMNDPIYGGDPKIKAVADAIETLDQARTTYQQTMNGAVQETGLNGGKLFDPEVTRRILDDIPDPVNPSWRLPDGTPYADAAFPQGGQWLSRDGQPLTFTRSMAWAADPVPDVVARLTDVHDAVRAKVQTATSGIVPTDSRFLKPNELQDALRLAQQMAGREGLSKSRAMLFGYDDRSQGQYLLDHWSPYSYWTVSHMLRTAQYLAPNPQAFAGMAIAIRQVAAMNQDQAPWDRFSVALFTAPDGTTVRLNPAQFFPYATQGIASLVSPDEESLAKNLLDLFGLSPHIPLNLAMQWVTTANPDNPYTTWYTGTKPGEKRARSLTPQTELVRLLSGGVIDIEGGKVFGATIPSFRKAIYGADAPASNATAATLELARRVFAGELTELDARRAILSWKDGKPNDVYRDAEAQGLRDKGIGALVRFLGAPVTIKSAEANRIDALYNQLEGIPKTDKKAAAALFDQNPDLSVYSSAGQNTTADKLRQSIAIDEQPTYTGGTPEQQARWTMANKIYGDAYGKAIDAGKSTSVAAQEARSALEQAGYDYNDFQLGNYYENPERKRLLAEVGGYEFTPSRARYSDQASVTPEELVKRDNAQDLYYQNRDTMNARAREARVIAQFGAATWNAVKATALKLDGTKTFGGTSAPVSSSARSQGATSSNTNAPRQMGATNTRSMGSGRSSSSRVDWDTDPVAKGIDGQPFTVRQFWQESELLRQRGQTNDANRQLALNWDALKAAGVKLEGNPPKYRNEQQEAAYQERAAILEQYSRLRDRNAEAAAKFYSQNADKLNELKAKIEGKPYTPSSIFWQRDPNPRRSGGGSVRGGPRPVTVRPTTSRQPVTFETDSETQSLRNYFRGLQGTPNAAYIKRIRSKYNLGLPASLTDEQWLEQAKVLFTAQQAA